MAKQELLNKLDKIIEEIVIVEWAKIKATEFINGKVKKTGKDAQVTYEIMQGSAAWDVKIKPDTPDEAIERLKELPIFEKYFLFAYTLYENYLSDNSDFDKDKNSVDLLRYRIIRSILVHNNKTVRQSDIDEFDKLAKKYDQSLSSGRLKKLFNYRNGAKLSLFEFDIFTLQKFRKCLSDTL